MADHGTFHAGASIVDDADVPTFEASGGDWSQIAEEAARLGEERIIALTALAGALAATPLGERVGEAVEKLAAGSVADAHLTVVDGASLFVHEERPAEVARALLPVLTGRSR